MNINKKSILISIVILALIVSGIYFLSNYSKFFKNIYSGFKSSAGESAKDYYTKGIEFYKAKKYDKAISAFKNAIDLDPQFKRAYIKSATIFIERRNFDDAIVYFEKLIEQHPEISFPYFARGLVLAEKKDYANAIKNYQQAIQLNLKFASVYAALADAFNKSDQLDKGIEWISNIAKTKPEDPYAIYGLAWAYKLQANWDKAFENLEKAIRVNPEFLEAFHLKIISLRDIDKFDEALNVGQTALTIMEQKEELELKLSILIAMGTTYYSSGQYDNALQFYEHALAIARQIADKNNQASCLGNMVNVYRGWGEFQKAIEYSHQTLALGREIGNYRKQGLALSNLGDIYLELSEYDTALTYLQQSLMIIREMKDPLNEAKTLGSIAAAYSYMADYPMAEDVGKQAFKIYRGLQNKSGEANELGNLGAVHIETGDYAKALDYYLQAYSISKQINDQYNQQIHLSGIGHFYYATRDFQTALNYFQQSLSIAQQIEDKSSEAICFLNIAATEKELGKTTASLGYLEKALNIFDAIGDAGKKGVVYADLATIFSELGQYDKAKQYYENSLEIVRRIRYRFGEAKTSNEMGMLYQKLGKYPDAIKFHHNALAIAKDIASLEIQWETNFALGKAFEKQNNISEAIECYKQAIDIIENIRSQFELDEQKSSFIEDKIEIYERLIHLYFMLNQKEPNKKYDEQSFCYAEKGRARALLDLLAESKINVDQTLNPDLQQRQKEIYRKISRLLTDVRDTTLAVSQRNEIYAKLKQEEENLQNLSLEIKRQNPAYANLKYPEPMTVADVQKNVLEKNDLLVEYLLGEEQSYLWAVTKDSFAMLALQPVKKIEQQVKHYLDIISRPPEAYSFPRTIGDSLFNMLLKPAASYIHPNFNLIIVPDGILHYLAFEALTLPWVNEKTAYLIDSCNISYAPSSSVLHFIKDQARKSVSKRELLAFGDPMFGDEAKDQEEQNKKEETTDRGLYQKEGFKFDRLPYTTTEIENITRLIPKSDYTSYLRAQATEEQVKAENLSQYRLIHYATHGLLDEEFPGRSSIVLTLDDDPNEDGFLQTNEIFNLKLDAALVVLSACQTGKGKLLNGEGIVGLSRAFLYAGARSLVVSLWSVNDQSTAKFMDKFYRNVQQGETKAEALRRTKLDFIKGEIISWQHPFYWAPFVLQGENK